MPQRTLRAISAGDIGENLKQFEARVSNYFSSLSIENPAPHITKPDWLALRKASAECGMTKLGLTDRNDMEHVKYGVSMYYAGKYDCDAREVVGVGHARPALERGSEKVRQKAYKMAIEEGELIGVASSEPQGGLQRSNFKTSVVETTNGKLKLNGTKGLIARINEASAFIVFAKKLSTGALVALWVDASQKGISRRTVPAMGVKGWSYGYLDFNDVILEQDDIISESGIEAFNKHFSTWRIYMTLLCLGAAKVSLEETAEMHGVSEKRVADAIVQRMGQHEAMCQSAISHCLLLLKSIDEGYVAHSTECSAAKALGTDAAFSAVDEMLQLNGNRGYAIENPIEKRFRDIRGFRIADGSNDALYSSRGRYLLSKKHSDTPEIIARKQCPLDFKLGL